jgi:hypothetical protein
MGNFSVNHYSKITLESDRIRVRYFIDLAEIPTYQELQEANIPATAIDPKSTAVIELRDLREALNSAAGSFSMWMVSRFPSSHLQRGHLSPRRGRPAHNEDGLCLRSAVSGLIVPA